MKIIIVKFCKKCPYLSICTKNDICSKLGRTVKDSKEIPKWCPLEDFKNEKIL